MSSLLELVERVNHGEAIDADLLEVYQQSPNSAERFLAHHARALLDLRRAHQHLEQSLEAIDYSDQKVLNEFVSVSTFLNQTDTRAGAVVRFAASSLRRGERTLAMEAIQNALSADAQTGGTFLADRSNALMIAEQYARVADALAWHRPHRPFGAGESAASAPPIRLAYVTSAVADDEPAGRALRAWARHHDAARCGLSVYSTESAVRRDARRFPQSTYAPSSARRGARTLDLLTRRNVPVWLSPLDRDAADSATALADQLALDRIDVAIFDASPADPIAATVANWSVAPVKLGLCRRFPLYADGLAAVLYTHPAPYEADAEFWRRRAIESRFILEGVDFSENPGPPPQRSAYGIPEHAVVLATAAADLESALTEAFVEAVIAILRQNPQAVYLLVGPGELAWQKRKFESAGLAKRIGYAGPRRDLPGFLRLADLYLPPFSAAADADTRRSAFEATLQAMAVERCVLAYRTQWGEELEDSPSAHLAGPEATVTSPEPAAFVQRASQLVREPAERQRIARVLRQRAKQEFSFERTVRQIEALCSELLRGERPGETPVSEPMEMPLEQAA